MPTDALPSWSSIGRFLDEIDGFKPGLPLYITEAGYTTAATPYRDTKVTEEQQAEYLTQIYSLPQLQTERVKTVSGSTSRTTSTGRRGSCARASSPSRATTGSSRSSRVRGAPAWADGPGGLAAGGRPPGQALSGVFGPTVNVTLSSCVVASSTPSSSSGLASGPT